jgi:hypothetical protein
MGVRVSGWNIWGRTATLAALTMCAALLTAAPAAAASFTWNVNASGAWELPTNWRCDTTPDCGVGFPSAQGDVANFTGNYSAALTITIPDRAIRIGEIIIGSPHAIVIQAGTVNSKLILDNGEIPVTPAPVVRNVASDEADTIDVPIQLDTPMTITPSGGHILRIVQPISGNNGISIIGPGEVDMNVATNSTYSGTTTVLRGGILRLGVLAAGGGVTIAGPIVVVRSVRRSSSTSPAKFNRACRSP